MLERVRAAFHRAMDYTLVLILCAVGALGLFELLDRLVLGSDKDELLYGREETLMTGYLDLMSGVTHISSNHKHKGPAPWEGNIQYPEGHEIESNKFGFYTELPVDDFPDKQEHEFRIILIGGSGAQGNGARTNGDMFYSLLQSHLNEAFGGDVLIRVVNLAMPGQHVVTNLFDLRAYAHPLQPDLILAYNGVNDTVQVMAGGFMNAGRIAGLENANTSYPWYLEWLVDLFPRTMLKYGIGPRLRDLFGEDRTSVTLTYSVPEILGTGIRRPLGPSGKGEAARQFFYSYLVDNAVAAFKAIKREFCGLPIVVVRQISTEETARNKRAEATYELTGMLPKPFYAEWWSALQLGLSGYVNDSWYFFDAQGFVWNNTTEGDEGRTLAWIDGSEIHFASQTFDTHLDNLGNKIVAEWLAYKLEPVIRKEYPRSRDEICEANFRSTSAPAVGG